MAVATGAPLAVQGSAGTPQPWLLMRWRWAPGTPPAPVPGVGTTRDSRAPGGGLVATVSVLSVTDCRLPREVQQPAVLGDREERFLFQVGSDRPASDGALSVVMATEPCQPL